jgi:hypothetical protein
MLMWRELDVPKLHPKDVRCLHSPDPYTGAEHCLGLVAQVKEGGSDPGYKCLRCGTWWLKKMLDAMNLIEMDAGTIPYRVDKEVVRTFVEEVL